ncbi:hypothetical protein WR25_14615 [Diploscapter pachys]|uniref:Uncharacterized protein n=1 Tax=Diploscapter pachys TaxID=2018661 RepID=A0A2A2M2W9_9BILA|nr:hypothetical protein WR25_14615 [Diploscapter pachys]
MMKTNYFQRLDDPKEVIAIIFVDIVNDIEPDLKKVFGVDRVPKAAQSKMPKFGGHIARLADLIDQLIPVNSLFQLTSMIGYTENLTGAWQLIRKTGRSHVRQG